MKISQVAATVLAAGTAALVAAPALPAAASTPAPAATKALVTRLAAEGGRPSADGRWMSMPGGVDVSVVPMSFSSCPSGWVCLWKDGGYSGRMLKWSDPGTSIAHLSDYGFNDEMSSWANRGPHLARWWVDASYKGTSHDMPAYSSSAHGGDDVASSLKIY